MTDTTPMIPDDKKHLFGEIVIDAALDDEAFKALQKNPHDVIASGVGGTSIDVSRLPKKINVVQSSSKEGWLVVPNRDMVKQIIDDIKKAEDGGEEPYAHPEGYSNTGEPLLKKYKYRVGDYVLALCG